MSATLSIDGGFTIIIDESENVVGTEADARLSKNRLLIDALMTGVVSAANSTATPLGIDGVFTGTAEDVSDFSTIYVQTYSDVASATDGLSFQYSVDGTNWDSDDVYTVPAAKGKFYSLPPQAKYFRLVYTNGGTAQTDFRLQTIYKKVQATSSSHRIQDSISNDDDAELVKSVLTGQSPSGDYVNVQVNQFGQLSATVDQIAYDKPFAERFKNGGSSDMRVNGSVTPVDFTVPAHGTDDYVLSELRLIMVPTNIKFDKEITFADVSNVELANGIKIHGQTESGAFTHFTIKRNGDFLLSGSGAFIEPNAQRQIIVARFDLGQRLVLRGGSSDFMRVTIQDNLSATGSFGIYILEALLGGFRATP